MLEWVTKWGMVTNWAYSVEIDAESAGDGVVVQKVQKVPNKR